MDGDGGGGDGGADAVLITLVRFITPMPLAAASTRILDLSTTGRRHSLIYAGRAQEGARGGESGFDLTDGLIKWPK